MAEGYEKVLEVAGLDDHGSGALMTECPVHDDGSPSLSVKRGDDGRALIHCFAGCGTAEIASEWGLELRDLFTIGSDAVAETYVYTDEAGAPLYRVLRFSPKGFKQQRWNGADWEWGLGDQRRVLYRLPELIASTGPVYICEGEKDADNAAAMGVVATTILGGANKWRPEYRQYLAGRECVVVRDADAPGRKHAAMLRRELPDVRVLAPGGDRRDLTAHLLAGGTLEDLVEEGLDLSELEPFDWESYEYKPTEWLLHPYIPRSGRVLAFGKRGSLKSLWAIWVGAKLSQEGKRVAFFSLEMGLSDLHRRVKQARPNTANFDIFRSLSFNNTVQLDTVQRAMRGYDLIIIDSWSAAHHDNANNDEVARLDRQVFIPLIERTGASLLILDNTGNDVFTDHGRHKMDRARGASAKEDKMELALWFDRPYENNNYRTTITMKKMRLDEPIAEPVTIETPRDRVEFFYVDGEHLAGPAWPGDDVAGVQVTATPRGASSPVDDTPATHLADRLRAARTNDTLKREVIGDAGSEGLAPGVEPPATRTDAPERDHQAEAAPAAGV